MTACAINSLNDTLCVIVFTLSTKSMLVPCMGSSVTQSNSELSMLVSFAQITGRVRSSGRDNGIDNITITPIAASPTEEQKPSISNWIGRFYLMATPTAVPPVALR
jgi:hypothetical protein